MKTNTGEFLCFIFIVKVINFYIIENVIGTFEYGLSMNEVRNETPYLYFVHIKSNSALKSNKGHNLLKSVFEMAAMPFPFNGLLLCCVNLP